MCWLLSSQQSHTYHHPLQTHTPFSELLIIFQRTPPLGFRIQSVSLTFSNSEALLLQTWARSFFSWDVSHWSDSSLVYCSLLIRPWIPWEHTFLLKFCIHSSENYQPTQNFLHEISMLMFYVCIKLFLMTMQLCSQGLSFYLLPTVLVWYFL